MKLSIIIPVYNEEHTIDTLLEKVLAVQLPDNIEKEVIIVDDGSTDRTYELLQKHHIHESFNIYHLEQNAGKTAALSKGLENATGDIISIQDADLEYDPAEIPKLIQPIIENKTSIVYGSRFKGSIKNMKLINRVANLISNIVFNFLYSTEISDINTGHKIFRKEILQNIEIHSKDFTFETEITTKLIQKGHSIVEIPIDYVARSNREGKKINWIKALHMFWGMFKYRGK